MSDVPEKDRLIVFVGEQHVSAHSIQNSVRRTTGPFLCVLSPAGLKHIDTEPLKALLLECRAFNRDRSLTMATKDARLIESAQREGWHVIRTVKQLKTVLKGHPSEAEALRAFSPVIWRQNIRSRLQAAGLLALPKVRIWGLLIFSVVVFLFTFIKLLPTSEILIWPNQESEDFTTNVYLGVSGAVLPISPDRVRSLPMELLTVKVDRSLTYDQISKNFTGTNASMIVTVTNDTDEPYSLRKGTRLVNQAGMRFRLSEDVILDAHAKADTKAVADPLDQYGEVLGQRGNVPAGVKWDFPGLSEKEREHVFARNEKPATGGTTSYVTVLTKEDVFGSPKHAGAKQRLEEELLIVAKQQVEDQMTDFNQQTGGKYVQLEREELTKIAYHDFHLSEEFIGHSAASIPIQGSLDYTVVLYDENRLLGLLVDEVRKRVPFEKTLVEGSLSKGNMDIHVIPPWDDDLRWVKITADLTYNQRFILSPLTPIGAKFAKTIRDNVAGKSVIEANRVIKNLPEVSRIEIHVWPPWAGTLPEIGSSIAIREME